MISARDRRAENARMRVQAALGKRHLEELLRTCESFAWQRKKGRGSLVDHEPVGVVALITPSDCADQSDCLQGRARDRRRLH